ncbi:MAG TPA: hypothetical protein VGD60_14625 [Candidatus Acidoferrales bacterium]
MPKKLAYGGEDFFLFHGVENGTGNPDWLGEIFDWLSGSHEMAGGEPDSVGRVRYAETVFSRHKISPWKPQATLLMGWLETRLSDGRGAEGIAKPPSLIPGVEHIVVCTHDVDFYFVSRWRTFERLVKNLAIARVLYRSRGYFISNLKMLAQLLTGKRVGDYFPALLRAAKKYGFTSTIFVVSEKHHRRDPVYRLDHLAARLGEVAQAGFSIGLHGSYTSASERDSLTTEAASLKNAIGTKPVGGRQHWLRFASRTKLLSGVEKAGFQYDSSMGFAEMVGFRNGASFAFPPYDFEKEAPYSFLEIPLVLMDGNLEAACRAEGSDPRSIAAQVLRESRAHGWGGVAILWHNPIEAIHVPEEINQIFWKCARERSEFQEEWVSAESFISLCRDRYRDAGLLKGSSQ